MTRRGLFSRLGLAVLVFGAVWLLVILRWRQANRIPNGTDVGLYLFALPIGLLLVFWAVYKSSNALKKRRDAKAAAAAQAPAAAAPDTAPAVDPTLAWQLPVLAVAANLPAGDTPAALADAAREPRRVELHPSLKDARGLPTFAAEVDGVDAAALEAGLPDAAQTWPAARKRVLALALQVATQMLDAHFDALRPTPRPDAPLTRAKPAVLQLDWLLPAAWSDADRELARTWLVAQLADAGWASPELEVAAGATEPGAAVLKHLDDLNRAANEKRLPLPQLVIASDSHVDAATVAAWDAAHVLHGAKHPEGRIPGEGAAAVLVAPLKHPALPVIASLGRLFAAQRAKAVDQPQRLQADTLKTLAEQASTQAQWGGDSNLQLVTDSGARNSRQAETLSLAGTLLPDGDPGEVLLPLGTANGDAGAALILAAVAVAVDACATTRQPCLVVSNQDPLLRAVLSATPATEQPADPAAPAT